MYLNVAAKKQYKMVILVIKMEDRFYNDKFESKSVFLGEDDMEETGGQISNVGQPVDGSSDAEESQRLVNYIYNYIFYSFVNKFNNITHNS